MKTRIAALLIAATAFTAAAFADDTATTPGQAKQAWQQLSPEQKLAKREAWTQQSAEEKAALRQGMHRKMEMRHERHENRREFGQRMGR